VSRIDAIIDQVEQLPALPGTAVRLMRVVSDPQSTIDQIVEAIRYDQAITGEVLRLCNSAYFGLSRKVTSLHDAMVCIGTVKVLQLVMAVHANSVLQRRQEGYDLGEGMLWRHAVATALASASIGEKLKLANQSLAFTAGLLHDIGKVVLSSHVAEEFREIVRQVTEGRLSFVEAEKQILGISHEEVGARLAERWQFPEAIVRCIRHHHNPRGLDPPDDYVDAVYLANCVSLLLGVGIGADGLYYRADETIMQRHDLGERDLEEIGIQMLSELERVEEAFNDRSPNDRGSARVTH
jgi:putative nucleotidyltransferase with HDIG domain